MRTYSGLGKVYLTKRNLAYKPEILKLEKNNKMGSRIRIRILSFPSFPSLCGVSSVVCPVFLHLCANFLAHLKKKKKVALLEEEASVAECHHFRAKRKCCNLF